MAELPSARGDPNPNQIMPRPEVFDNKFWSATIKPRKLCYSQIQNQLKVSCQAKFRRFGTQPE